MLSWGKLFLSKQLQLVYTHNSGERVLCTMYFVVPVSSARRSRGSYVVTVAETPYIRGRGGRLAFFPIECVRQVKNDVVVSKSLIGLSMGGGLEKYV